MKPKRYKLISLLQTLLVWAFVGFLVQLVDGALVMADRVSSTTALVTIVVCSALAGASFRIAEMSTILVSRSAPFKLGYRELG